MKLMTRAHQRSLTAAFVFAAISLFCAFGAAQPSTTFQVEQFEPLPSQSTNTLNVMRSDVLGHLVPSAGLFLHFADDPLVLYRLENGERTIASRVIDDQLKAEVSLALGLFDMFDLGIVVPMALYQSGDGDELIGGSGGISGFALADPRIVPRLRLLNPEKAAGFGIAVAATVFVPLGNKDAYQTDGSVRAEPRLAFDYRVSRFMIAANIAYQARPEAVAHNHVSDDNLRWGLGVELGVGPEWLVLEGTLFGSYTLADGRDPDGLDTAVANVTGRPIEALAGLKFLLSNGLTLQAGGGAGLTSSVGTPDFRIFGGLDWSPRGGDRDQDGIRDSADECPDDPEDLDDFQDADGCPDLDDDNDQIPDTADECRLEPEDVDGFEDENGCPDPDNDQDGVLDVDDRCPMVPGTPDFQGCPDSDGDGIMDADDTCPNDPEDKDGFEDEDGCPDPDNDRDGILDVDDQCPMEPETINGVKDDDGCPDEGKSKVRITATKIEILDKVYFDTNRATIQGRSFDVLNQVASVMKANPQITRLQIEGHTDSRGKDSYNQELSQRRADAVQTYLEGRGLEPTRLTAKGFGEETPIADNETKVGRAENRRVEFTILETSAPVNVRESD